MKGHEILLKEVQSTPVIRIKNQISAAKEAGQQKFQVQKLQTDTAIKLTELELQAKRDLNKDVQDNQGALKGEGRSAEGSATGS